MPLDQAGHVERRDVELTFALLCHRGDQHDLVARRAGRKPFRMLRIPLAARDPHREFQAGRVSEIVEAPHPPCSIRAPSSPRREDWIAGSLGSSPTITRMKRCASLGAASARDNTGGTCGIGSQMQTVPRASPRPAAAVPLTAVLPTTAVPVAAVLPTTTVPLTAVLPVTVTALAVPAATALTGPALAPTGTSIAAIKSPATGKRRIAGSFRRPRESSAPSPRLVPLRPRGERSLVIQEAPQLA